jgi:PAP2 superfamily
MNVQGQNWGGKAFLTVLVVCCVLFLAFSFQFYNEAMVDAFFGLALASVLVLHFRIHPQWVDALIVSASAATIATIDFRILRYPPKVMACFSFLGLSSFAVMAIRSVWERNRKILLYAWVPAALFVVSNYFASTMLEWTSAAHPKTLDLYLLSFEGSLHFEPAFAAGRLYANHPGLHESALLAYIGLAIPITVVYAGRLLDSLKAAMTAMLAFLVTGPIGILFYNIFPACGPRSVLGLAFPFHPLPVSDLPRLLLEPIAIQGARNAIPSLHLAWTLLAFWLSKGLSRVERIVAFAFLALTAFATMGTGEHWFVDLVVAFPFALMIQAACAYDLTLTNPERLKSFFLGLFGTALWLASLRYGVKLFWTSPVIPWVLCLGTIVLVQLRQMTLVRAPSQASPATPIRVGAAPCETDDQGESRPAFELEVPSKP